MAKWLYMIGIGDNGFQSLSAEQHNICQQATVIFGSVRQLKTLPKLNAKLQPWQSPFMDNLEAIKAYRPQKLAQNGHNKACIVILATGDPMHYGIGATLLKYFSDIEHFSIDEIQILPSPSAFSLAASRLGWPLQDVISTSIHGRSIHLLNQHICHGAKIICLTSNGAEIDDIADLLVDQGYGESHLTLLEHMGGAQERILKATANGWQAGIAGDFNTIAIEIVADIFTQITPNIAGLNDRLFVHDGQITKADMRAITLNKLLPTPNSIMWDLGAGCGSVGIEYMRLAKNAKCHAVEKSYKRIANIQNNANHLGVPNISIYEAEHSVIVETLPKPDAIFIGGGLSLTLFQKCYERLPIGGRLVSNIVTLEGLGIIQQIIASFKENFNQLQHLNVSQHSDATLEMIGQLNSFKPKMTITQLALVKVKPAQSKITENRSHESHAS